MRRAHAAAQGARAPKRQAHALGQQPYALRPQPQAVSQQPHTPGRRRLLAGAAAIALAAAGAPAAATLPAVLQRPALPMAQATGAALLAAARAGRRLVVAGERGIVLTSDDHGQHWTQARVPVQVSLTSLAFADARRGWACGHFGVLLRTDDAGASWTLALDGQRAAQLALQAAADDAQRQAAQRLVQQGPDKPLFDVDAGSGHLFAVGAYGLALQARDGADWQSLAPRLPNPRHLHLYGLRTAGERVFIAGEQGLLLRSGNRGASFEALASPYKGSFFGLLATAGGSLLAYGLRGNVFRSGDGGDTWAQVGDGVPVGLGAALQRGDGRIVLAAQNGDLLLSHDDGRRFRRQPAASPFPAAALVEADGDWLVLAGLRGLRRVALA
jgi:photosystem II stability/assembly factor-like uncharacterized protein